MSFRYVFACEIRKKCLAEGPRRNKAGIAEFAFSSYHTHTTFRNSQFAIRNPKSAFRNPQSEILKSLTLPRSIHDAITAHASEGKPNEICGLLRGRNGVATDLLRANNVAPNPIIDYEVAPEALLAVFDWEDAGDELVAIYHSHPAGPAHPSATDAYKAYHPDTVILICSFQDEAKPLLRGFLLRELPGEIDLEAIQGELGFDENRPGRWSAYLPANNPSPPSLALLDQPAELALYVVFQQLRSGEVHVRAVTVEDVEVSVIE